MTFQGKELAHNLMIQTVRLCLVFTKSPKKQLLGRVKSCRWQVLACRRPPKQGVL